jgi:hypothetical protein
MYHIPKKTAEEGYVRLDLAIGFRIMFRFVLLLVLGDWCESK